MAEIGCLLVLGLVPAPVVPEKGVQNLAALVPAPVPVLREILTPAVRAYKGVRQIMIVSRERKSLVVLLCATKRNRKLYVSATRQRS